MTEAISGNLENEIRVLVSEIVEVEPEEVTLEADVTSHLIPFYNQVNSHIKPNIVYNVSR